MLQYSASCTLSHDAAPRTHYFQLYQTLQFACDLFSRFTSIAIIYGFYIKKSMQVYEIEESISDFFATSTSVTRRECDEYVQNRYGQSNPVPLQGCFSYTVLVNRYDRIVQFRQEQSTLDDSIMELVKLAAKEFVPETQYHGTLGDERPLHIYEMNKIPGEMYVSARNNSIPQADDVKARQRITIQDLAR